jgi:hypothetical protein
MNSVAVTTTISTQAHGDLALFIQKLTCIVFQMGRARLVTRGTTQKKHDPSPALGTINRA